MSNWTPTTEVIRHAVSFPRERLGEPRPIKPAVFDRWLEQVKQEARAEGWDLGVGVILVNGPLDLPRNPYRQKEQGA